MLCSNFSLSVAISVGDKILLHTEDSFKPDGEKARSDNTYTLCGRLHRNDLKGIGSKGCFLIEANSCFL